MCRGQSPPPDVFNTSDTGDARADLTAAAAGTGLLPYWAGRDIRPAAHAPGPACSSGGRAGRKGLRKEWEVAQP